MNVALGSYDILATCVVSVAAATLLELLYVSNSPVRVELTIKQQQGVLGESRRRQRDVQDVEKQCASLKMSMHA